MPPPIPRPIPAEDPPGTNRAACRGELLGLPLRVRDTVALVMLTCAADFCLYCRWGGAGGAVLLIVTLVGLLSLKLPQAAARPISAGFGVLLLATVLIWSAWWMPVALAVVAIFVLAVRLWRSEWALLESLWAMGASLVYAPSRLCGHGVARYEASRTTRRRPVPVKLVAIPLAGGHWGRG